MVAAIDGHEDVPEGPLDLQGWPPVLPGRRAKPPTGWLGAFRSEVPTHLPTLGRRGAPAGAARPSRGRDEDPPSYCAASASERTRHGGAAPTSAPARGLGLTASYT